MSGFNLALGQKWTILTDKRVMSLQISMTTQIQKPKHHDQTICQAWKPNIRIFELVEMITKCQKHKYVQLSGEWGNIDPSIKYSLQMIRSLKIEN